MIRLTRKVELPRVGALRLHVALRQPGFRVYAIELRNMSYDATTLGTSRLFKSGFANDLTLVLEGHWVDRRGNPEVLGAGDARWGAAATVLGDRWEPNLRLLTIEWSGSTLTGFTKQRCSSKTVSAAEDFFRVLCDEQTRCHDCSSLRTLVDALAEEGAPVPFSTILIPPDGVRRAADMLNSALMNLHDHPMWVDFTQSRSERQWRRDLTDSVEWLGLLGGTFRKTLNAIRLQQAAALLTIPSVTTREVAIQLGYSSDRALLGALQRAEIRLDALRESGKRMM